MTVKDIRDYVSYDPETGVMKWIKKPGYAIPIGSVAGNANPRGYHIFTFSGRQEYCHRVAFTLMNEPLLEGEQVDHINRLKGDNRWVNLRRATPSENSQNRAILDTNTSGVIGVCWDIHKNKWRVYRQHKHYGYFADLELAEAKSLEVSKELYKEFHIDN